MIYNDFHYERLDLEKSKYLINEVISDFKNAKSADKQIEAIKKVFSNKIFGILALPLGGEKGPSRIFDVKNNSYVR